MRTALLTATLLALPAAAQDVSESTTPSDQASATPADATEATAPPQAPPAAPEVVVAPPEGTDVSWSI